MEKKKSCAGSVVVMLCVDVDGDEGGHEDDEDADDDEVENDVLAQQCM